MGLENTTQLGSRASGQGLKAFSWRSVSFLDFLPIKSPSLPPLYQRGACGDFLMLVSTSRSASQVKSTPTPLCQRGGL
jgi:hypothetical protein